MRPIQMVKVRTLSLDLGSKRVLGYGSITQKNITHPGSFQFQLISEYWSNGVLE